MTDSADPVRTAEKYRDTADAEHNSRKSLIIAH
jgi:hypothetical protein